MSRKSRPIIRLALAGACGRMGRHIAALALADGAVTLVAVLEAEGHPDLGKDYGALLGRDRIGVVVETALDVAADVLVDFSSAQSAASRAAECARRRIALVLGTTGLDPAARKAVDAAAKRVPVVFAPNMSVGVNALIQALPELVRLLGPGYDIEIVEAHHRLKKDAPSGTALALAGAVAEAAGIDLAQDAVYGRQGITGERPARQIGLHAVRGGDIVGDHRILFAGAGESIEVIHRAHSRETFAAGAVRAALFAAGARPGLYTMVDVLRRR
jgi:4-hydroxy-tetrahydrodipicolinate reductase